MYIFKRFVAVMLCMLLVFSLIPISAPDAQAATTYYDGVWAYTVTEGYATLVGVTQKMTGDTCGPPSTLGGYPLKVIDGSFVNVKTTQFVLPKGVEVIASHTFNTAGFSTIVLPKSLRVIDFNAFVNCFWLNTIYYAGSYSDWNSISKSWHTGIEDDVYFSYNYVYPLANNEIETMLGQIDLGPYALKGAVIEVLGKEIPLINLEAKIGLNIGTNFKIIAKDTSTVKVLLGFDQNASANVQESATSKTYWSDSYQEVKTMYQNLTGQKVDTTRLWNKFSAMRGKLKTINANMVVGVDSSLTGYAEFKLVNGEYVFSDGGVIALFDAKTSFRSYYGPCYVALGIEANVEGSLVFTNENNKINPSITVSPEFTVALSGGIGTRSTYAEIGAFGTLAANISTASESPFEAGVYIGVRWMGFLLGKELFSDEATLPGVELYPNTGNPWPKKRNLTPDIDVSDVEKYNELINEANSISRDYLSRHKRNAVKEEATGFIKENVYPLSSPNLVRFDDDTMLLVWVDDLGKKTDENMCSLMYSYYDGNVWSAPETVYEDGTANDMPNVYSDGRYAYIVWQKAEQKFEASITTEEMLQHFDLYAVVFDSQNQIFTTPVCVNSKTDAIFEFNPVVYGTEGRLTVVWLENSDNNVYQMSGENKLSMCSISEDGCIVEEKELSVTDNMFTDLVLAESGVYYSVLESDSNNLYTYQDAVIQLKQGVGTLSYAGEKLFYTAGDGLHSYDGENDLIYDIGVLDEFEVVCNEGEYLLFASVLNEDFTKNLYFSRMIGESWTDFEAYSVSGKYIRDYSPVLLSNDEIFVSFNYITADMQTATLVVDQCTDALDVALTYVDFDDSQMATRNLELQLGVENGSSKTIDSFTVRIEDLAGNLLNTQKINGELIGFESGVLTANYTVPEQCDSNVYQITVLPSNYIDWNEQNNTVTTAFECNHNQSSVWKLYVPPTENENGLLSQNCLKCNKVMDTKEIKYLQIYDTFFSEDETLNVKCRVDASLIKNEGYVNPQVVFNINGEEFVQKTYSSQDGYYVFTLDNIKPEQMGMAVHATLYATRDGVLCSSVSQSITLPELGILAWNLTLKEDISVNFQICLTEILVNDTVINVTLGNESYSVNAKELQLGDNGCYILKVNVTAAQMMDAISVQLNMGAETGSTKVYSVREYADTVLADSTMTKCHSLIKAMLHYGAAAQKYFDYNTEHLASDGVVTDLVTVPESVNTETIVSGSVPEISFYGATLVFGSQTSVRYYFKVTDTINKFTFSVGEKSYPAIEKNGYWYVEMVGIKPHNLDEAMTMIVSNGAANMTVTYGPMDYIVRMYHRTSSENMKQLLQAMYGYYEAAEEYITVASGECGTNARWRLTDDGTLSITGSGQMYEDDLMMEYVWSKYSSQIKSVVIEEGITSIASYAFWFCRNLSDVSIPEGVTYIGYDAFSGCESLVDVDLPDSLVTIKDYAFNDCEQLKKITIPEKVTKIGRSAFSYCDSLTDFYVDEQNQFYSSVDGLLCTKDGKELLVFPSGRSNENSVLPNTITTIGNYAFHGCENLTSIKLCNSVTTLKDDAFFGCYSITSITIPASVTSIGSDALWCNKLKEVYFEGNAPTIASDAFYNTTLIAYYPSGNSTWTSSKRQNYGGSVTWKTYVVGKT